MANANALRRAFVASLVLTATLLVAGLLLLPTTMRSVSSQAAVDAPLALTHATVFDGEKWHTDVTLLVDNGYVVSLGSDVTIPEQARRLDAADQFIVPGLIDAHTHTVGPALRESLRFGVSTNLDMFTAARLLPQTRAQRASTAPTAQADLFSAGVLGTVEGGHGTQYGVPVEVLNGAGGAAEWVQRRLAEGSDYIKFVYMPYQDRLPSLDLATARALILAAHEAGVLAVAHISSGRAARDMLDAGIDGLVHIWSDTTVTDDFIADARAANLFVIPTLAVFATADQSGEGGALADDPAIAPYLSGSQRASLGSDFGIKVPSMPLNRAIENARRLHAGGVTLLAGSDAPNPGTTHGASLHHELDLLRRAGLTPDELLHAATAGPAARFRLAERGRIQPGARADFLLLSADPRDSILATRRIDAVYKNGFAVSRELEALATDGNEVIPTGPIGEFAAGNTAPDGYAWSATDDRSFGGESDALVRHDAKSGALGVDVAVRPGFSFPWAGVYFGPTNNAARSFGGARTLRLKLRGTPGTYRVMFFNAGSMGAPPTVDIELAADWQTVRIDLAGVRNLERDSVAGLAIVAGPAPVEAHFELAEAWLDP